LPAASTTPTSDLATPARYRAIDPSQLRWLELDAEFVLYHRPSGKTHFLNATSACLLMEILARPRTAAEATSLLLESQATPIEDAQHEYVRGLLQRFAELGIIDD
jgi:PqqD family protein of HPr-rel-A system